MVTLYSSALSFLGLSGRGEVWYPSKPAFGLESTPKEHKYPIYLYFTG